MSLFVIVIKLHEGSPRSQCGETLCGEITPTRSSTSTWTVNLPPGSDFTPLSVPQRTLKFDSSSGKRCAQISREWRRINHCRTQCSPCIGTPSKVNENSRVSLTMCKISSTHRRNDQRRRIVVQERKWRRSMIWRCDHRLGNKICGTRFMNMYTFPANTSLLVWNVEPANTICTEIRKLEVWSKSECQNLNNC